MKTINRWSLAIISLGIGLGLGFYLSGFRPVQAVQQPTNIIPKEITSYRDIVKRVIPAVVSIEAISKSKKPRPKDAPNNEPNLQAIGFGSGVIVDPRGIILTNYHVVEGAELVEVSLPDGRTFNTKDIRGDRKTDLAIIRIQSEKALPVLEFGDSDVMEVGDRVLAIGAPFGLTGSVTHGIISAKSRNVRINQYEDFLQTDAAINPGNSGGPLINLEGRVIGINSAIKSKSGGFQGIGLAISSKLAKSIMKQLLESGVVRRGYLGVAIRDNEPAIAEKLGIKETTGVYVTKIYENTPAAKSNIKIADLILIIGGKQVRDGNDLSKVVADMPLNRPVDVQILREGQPMIISIVIEEQPEKFGLNN